MRNYLLICLSTVLLAISTSAATVRLAWDASATAGITNYVLYAHTNALDNTNLTNAVVRVDTGTNTTATIEALNPGRWWFAATAMKDGIESDASNVLGVEVPAAPTGTRTVVIQYSTNLTNFSNVGYFRLKIPQ